MGKIAKKNFNQPEKTLKTEMSKMDIILIGGSELQRVTAMPGWRWSKHTKPIVGGESCQVHHLLYIISGNLHVRMNDGQELELGPSEIGDIPPGHDGWNAGDEPLIWLEIPHS